MTIGAMVNVFVGFKDIVVGIFDAIVGAIKTAINTIVISPLNFMIRMANKAIRWIPGVPYVGGSKGYQIPKLHEGGTVTSPGAVNWQPGEETVSNMPKGATVTPLTPGQKAGGVDAAFKNRTRTDAEIRMTAKEQAAATTKESKKAGPRRLIGSQEIVIHLGKHKQFAKAVIDVIEEANDIRLVPRTS